MDEFLCTQYLRIVSTELCIDDYHDFGYWKYLHATPLYRMKARDYCKTLYVDFMTEYQWLGDLN